MTLRFLRRQCLAALASAPVVFHTPFYESPVVGGPDDLLFIGGVGFHADDRVVYQAIGKGKADSSISHPTSIPTTSTADLGTAKVVKLGDPPLSITALLPPAVSARRSYRLWVVDTESQWSESFTINDPRPLWVSPAVVYATADVAELGRQLRIVGRNLGPDEQGRPVQVRLQGPQTYELKAAATSVKIAAVDAKATTATAATAATAKAATAKATAADAKATTASAMSASADYISEAALPPRLEPGTYTVSVSHDGSLWAALPEQTLTVSADPPKPTRFDPSDQRFGGCKPDDGKDDLPCLRQAIAAAKQSGGGVVALTKGTWDLFPAAGHPEAELILSEGVSLEGAAVVSDAASLSARSGYSAASVQTTLLRHAATQAPSVDPWLIVEGHNSLTQLRFTDEQRFEGWSIERPVIQLGHRWDDPRVRDGKLPRAVRQVIISKNVFRRVNIPVFDAGLPISQLYVTRNDIGGYSRGLELPGISRSGSVLFTIEDSVIRWNRFLPGSYIDVKAGQGVIATGMGGSRRVDLSSNDVDGSSAEALQSPSDPHGWRAAFFWNMDDSGEMLLVAGNRIQCPGDKTGDGEALSFDRNQDTFGFQPVVKVTVTASAKGAVTVFGDLARQPARWGSASDSHYLGHWIQVVAGPGMGQTRRIQRYHSDPDTHAVSFEVSPQWDVAPVSGQSQIVVTRQFWQTYVVDNDISQAGPACLKSNRSGPKGGEINMWAPSADTVFAGNRQYDTSGIGFTQGYVATTRSCPQCNYGMTYETALEIRDNLIRGEYDWDSDCSWSGIHATYGASPTPEAPPPVVSFGVQIIHNEVDHADGLRGGGLDVVPTWHTGPEPKRPLINNMIMAHNTLEYLEGSAPRSACNINQRGRIGIRLEGGANVTDTVLYKNTCEKVTIPLQDGARHTLQVTADPPSAQVCR